MTSSPRPTDIARDVLDIERAALATMRDALPPAFDPVVDLLLAVPGRVIVSGMGKSGHVAAKIAATMASTGTPAQYVHPGEASHGDLGMITAQDAVILISNSGETRELADIIAHTRRFSIPLIGITKRRAARSRCSPITCCNCPTPPRPAPSAWRRPRRPPARWRSAMRWRWR